MQKEALALRETIAKRLEGRDWRGERQKEDGYEQGENEAKVIRGQIGANQIWNEIMGGYIESNSCCVRMYSLSSANVLQ